MAQPRILVVDDDAWILRMVTTVLEKRGYEIFVAADGEDGLARARSVAPDLIITDVMMPRLDGWGLVKKLRATPELAFVPVIFLTALGSDEDRIRGFRLGADDYLPKPFRFEELDLRVAKAMKRLHPEASTRAVVRAARPVRPLSHSEKPVPGLRGTLDQLGFSSLLIVLEMERKSGVLVVTHPAADGGRLVARVFLRAGRVVRARIEGTSTKSSGAIYEVLTWPSGSFEFTALDVDMEDEIKLSTTALLMEGARRIDEAEARAAAKER